MSESITKELRRWAHGHDHILDFAREDVDRIADRIDDAHRRGVRHAYDVGFASADDWYADKTDDDLAEHGLVRLPVDADGKTWHIGDMVTLDDRAHSKVIGIELAKDGWNLVLPSGGYASAMPKCYHHYSPTPAERIRAWVDSARDDRADLRDLLAIADELEADDE